VSWRFRLDRPGTFELIADLASTQPGSRFRVEVGDQVLQAEAPNTGDYDTFRKVTLGRLSLSGAGEKELLIRPTPGAWRALNLRSLVLKPAG